MNTENKKYAVSREPQVSNIFYVSVSFVFQLHKRPDVPLYKKIRSSKVLPHYLLHLDCMQNVCFVLKVLLDLKI